MTRLYAGVDIGGSHIGIGLLDNDANILDFRSVDIDKAATPTGVVELVFDACNDMLDNITGDIVSIGIGCPGSSKDGILFAASNLPEFKNVPLADLISQKFNNVPTILLNDAKCALSAELRSPGGRIEYKDVRYAAIITIGTGIGVSFYLDGKMYEGANNTIEAGHHIIATHPGASRCPCGQTGCVEMYCSASNTARRMRELDELILSRLRSAKTEDTPTENETGANEETVDMVAYEEMANSSLEAGARGAFERAANGDALAEQIVEEVWFILYSLYQSYIISIILQTSKYIAVLCINLCRVLDLEVIIIGGGMAQAGDELLVRVKSMIAANTWTVLPTDVRVCLAQCMHHTGMIGAALDGKELVIDDGLLSDDDGRFNDDYDTNFASDKNIGYGDDDVEAGKISDLGSLTALSDNAVENYSSNTWNTEELKALSDIRSVTAMNNSVVVAASAGLSVTVLCTVAAVASVGMKLIEPKPNSMLSAFARFVLDSVNNVGGPAGMLTSLVATQGLLFLGQAAVAYNVFRRTQEWRRK
jgi:glucokinase